MKQAKDFKPGTHVRVEFTGTVHYARSLAENCVRVLSNFDTDLYIPLQFVEVIAPPLPPEPPIGSFGVDSHEDVWKHTEAGWQAGIGNYIVCAYDWPSLNEQYGPITELVRKDQNTHNTYTAQTPQEQ